MYCFKCVIFVIRISMLYSLISLFNLFHHINYEYWFSGIYNILFMISMVKPCYIIFCHVYTSNINGIIAVNAGCSFNIPSTILVTFFDSAIIWVLVNGTNIRFATGVHVVIIRIIINNIIIIVNHDKLEQLYRITEPSLHKNLIILNILKISILHYIFV